MYGKMKKHTTHSRHHEDMPHHMAPKSHTLLNQGKAIPTGQKGMSWTDNPGGQKAGLSKGVGGMARKRRTMMNRRPQGTGHSGKAGRHITVPKVGKGGFYALRDEARGY